MLYGNSSSAGFCCRLWWKKKALWSSLVVLWNGQHGGKTHNEKNSQPDVRTSWFQSIFLYTCSITIWFCRLSNTSFIFCSHILQWFPFFSLCLGQSYPHTFAPCCGYPPTRYLR